MSDRPQRNDTEQQATAKPVASRRKARTGGRRAPAGPPRRLSDLSPTERRWAVFRTVVVVFVCWTALLALFYAAPEARDSAVNILPRLTVGLAVLVGILAWQNSRIGKAELPELRAARAMGVVLPLFLVVFATIYLSLSHTSAANFSQPVDHTKALYFTITVFSTVGFGDITPTTDTARTVVSIQMLLDLVIFGVVVRLLLNAAHNALAGVDRNSAGSS